MSRLSVRSVLVSVGLVTTMHLDRHFASKAFKQLEWEHSGIKPIDMTGKRPSGWLVTCEVPLGIMLPTCTVAVRTSGMLVFSVEMSAKS